MRSNDHKWAEAISIELAECEKQEKLVISDAAHGRGETEWERGGGEGGKIRQGSHTDDGQHVARTPMLDGYIYAVLADRPS